MSKKLARLIQQHAPVLVIGDGADPQSRRQALEMGAVEYLEHPVSPDDIVHAFLPASARIGPRMREH